MKRLSAQARDWRLGRLGVWLTRVLRASGMRRCGAGSRILLTSGRRLTCGSRLGGDAGEQRRQSRLRVLVCGGEMTLDEALAAFAAAVATEDCD